MSKVFSFGLRISLLTVATAAVLSRVQTHAEATGAGTLSTTSPTPAQAVSSSTVTDSTAISWIRPQECHAWARFEPGSWREVEITTETFDQQGQVFGKSVTTQKEILNAIADDSYVIDVQATVDVSGKRIAGPSNTQVLRLSTDRPGAVFSCVRQQDEPLPLNIGEVECQVFEVRYTDESRNLCDRIYFSRDVFPHVLYRGTRELPDDNRSAGSPQDTVSIVARSVPYEWEGRIIDCVTQQAIRIRAKGESQTLTVLSPEIPGGEIRSHSTDFDSSGKRIRWSVQRLVAYGTTHTQGGRDGTAIRVPAGSGQDSR